MLKKLYLFLSFVLLTFAALGQKIPEKPNPPKLVVDKTGTLSPDEQQLLENKLDAFANSTSTQIEVVILKDLQGDDANDFAQKLGRAWGIGQKGKNNGVVVLIGINNDTVPKLHAVSIQTGYGEEGAVTDINTHLIIENDITPLFRQNNYYRGLDSATSDLMKLMNGDYKAPAQERYTRRRNDDSSGGSAVFIIIFIIIVVLIIIRRGGGGGGRVYGGGGNPFWWFLAGSLLGGGGRGWGGGGGDWGGGGFGGDSGGGGFGGFGGGDFGGGGSSGSW